MYIRCTECQSTVRMELGFSGEALHCTGCGSRHSLRKLESIGRTGRQRTERALRFADENDVDLASAYSVLLGLCKLEDCERLDSSAKTTPANWTGGGGGSATIPVLRQPWPRAS